MIRSQADIAAAIETLGRLDERLRPVIERAGSVPLRWSPPGLRGLAGVIIGQQVSRASAAAILARFDAAVDLDDPQAMLAAGDDVFRLAGLSQAKQRTVRDLAHRVAAGTLDLEAVAALPPGEAIRALSAVPGIGTWTAECFLLFSAGHPDIFPAGDLALAHAVSHALALDGRPKEKALAAHAAAWAPNRSAAARLFWSYYAAITRREAAPVAI